MKYDSLLGDALSSDNKLFVNAKGELVLDPPIGGGSGSSRVFNIINYSRRSHSRAGYLDPIRCGLTGRRASIASQVAPVILGSPCSFQFWFPYSESTCHSVTSRA